MAKAKQTRRMVAMALAAAVTMSSVPVVAFAEEVPASETSAPASDTTTSTEKTETPTSDGGTQITETTTTTTGTANAETGETGDNGSIEFKTEVTIKDANDNVVSEYTVVEGESTTTTPTEDDGNEPDQTPVEVPVVPGETTTGTASTTKTTGDTPDGEDDPNYDYTETTETDRTVTVETSDVEVTVNDSEEIEGAKGDAEGLKGLPPVYDETDDPYVKNKEVETGKDGVFDRNFLSGSNMDPSKWTDIPPEGEYRYVGTGEHSKYFVGMVKVIYEKDAETGETVCDANGKPVIKEIVNSVSGDIQYDVNGNPITEIVSETEFGSFAGSRAQNFMLMDKNGNKVFAYCSDLQTGANNGKWYSVSNLEDSDYYTPEAEDHIRSIVMNGYWGTSDVPTESEDGTKAYQTGSLEGIKANMLKAIENGEIDPMVQVPVRDTSTEGAGKIQVDENGNPIYYEEKMDLREILGGMTEGEALLATQAAIWSFANGSAASELSGVDGSVLVTPDWYRNHQIGYGKVEGEPLDDAAGARVAALYNWLMNLETEETKDVVINEKNFVDEMSLIVGDKVADHADNNDGNDDNDVYHTQVSFSLEFVPGENDDLLVQVKYKDLDGNEQQVTKRLAGGDVNNPDYETITPAEDGSYVISGLQLSENKDFNFDLRLEGTQYLEQGVYVYAPVGGRDVSQTFVGIAEGERNVDVSMGMTISFDVDEDDNLTATRKWRTTSRHSNSGGGNDPKDPTPDPEDPNSTPEDPGMIIPDEDVPLAGVDPEEELADIADEEVPMADAPEEPMVLGAEEEAPLIAATGDSNHMAAGFGGMFAALAGMFFLRKKKED